MLMMKLSSNNFFAVLLLFLMCVIAITVISCSTVDYISFPQQFHGSKIIGRNEIKLITYNIKAIYEKEEDQVDSLVSVINKEKFDFVIFQELFDESTRDDIVEKADKSHYKTVIARIDYNSFPEFIFQDAGLFMLSSCPRIDLSEVDFGDDIKNSNGVIHSILEKEISKTNDFLANKSVMGALFKINDDTELFLFTTHVQAIGSTEIKERQLEQISTFIEEAVNGVLNSGKIKSSQNMIVLLAGDFNSNAYDKERIGRLESILNFPRDLHKEFHGDKEEHTFRFSSRNASRRFDYIFAYDSLNQTKFKRVGVQSINAIDIKGKDSLSISDHLGLSGILNIN